LREKIYRSLNTSDLSDEQWENAAHVVASLGAAQINRKHLALGALLLHIKGGHHNFIPKVLSLLALRIASTARRDAWKGVGRHNAQRLAEIALDRFLDNLCGTCNGVGTVGELGQIIVICQTCNGSRTRQQDDLATAKLLAMDLATFRKLEIQARISEIVAMLDRMEGHATGATREKARERQPAWPQASDHAGMEVEAARNPSD
jgi:hypothetical protein